jgi:membrane protease YdiL (CAAX protease family)
MNKKTTNLSYSLSPIIILIVTQAIALLLGKYLNAWVYLPIILIYWAVLILILYRYGFDHIKTWLKKPQGHWSWFILAAVLGVSSLPLFLNNLRLFKNPVVLIPHILFFLINPWLEEFYWRGMLLDTTKKWPLGASVIYSSVLFTVWHTAFAWYSIGVRDITFYLPVLVMGIFMGLMYKYTKSLWLCIASHMLINILNMGIPVLMNLVEF